MTSDSSPAAKKIYRAGDAITAKLTLAAGHDRPASTSATFTLTPPPTAWDPNRLSSFTIWMAMPAMQLSPPASPSTVITLTGQIPHHIVGGTYKPTSVAFNLPNELPQSDSNPDPDGDLVFTIVDDPPNPIDKPVIKDFDLA